MAFLSYMSDLQLKEIQSEKYKDISHKMDLTSFGINKFFICYKIHTVDERRFLVSFG